MKTLKITTDKKISIVDVDFKDFDRRYGYVGSKSNAEIYIRSRN